MLYKEFEKFISDMVDGIKPKEALISYDRCQLDLCKAEIKYKDGHYVASWRKGSRGTEAQFFQDASGETKVKWSEVCYISIKLAD